MSRINVFYVDTWRSLQFKKSQTLIQFFKSFIGPTYFFSFANYESEYKADKINYLNYHVWLNVRNVNDVFHS